VSASGGARHGGWGRLSGGGIDDDGVAEFFELRDKPAGVGFLVAFGVVRHSYATAALKAGVSPKITSERLGHANAAFTLQTYTHVIPGMDELAASTVAALILGPDDEAAEDEPEADGRTFGRQEEDMGPEMQLTWAKAQVSDSSGGRI
jgi:hypothetical protein